ncbi:two-component system, sporulation sensor kinase E [Tumebacillus permanentifrigoris]|uniref:histidine kinase n=2 Tax=Tumebacillus permanentifrigoris TaxID=378543 RepID=A0A316D7J8_9BACL|nr:two-component system, sporulation sensor kinase E [Tumebacillus permanentifrigoris]
MLSANRAASQIGTQSYEELLLPADRANVRAWLMGAVAQQVPHGGQSALAHPVQGRLQAAWTVLPIVEAQQTVGLYLIARNLAVEESPPPDDELREVKELLESVFRYTKDAIVLFDPNGVVLRVNEAFERIFGYERSELMGRWLPVTPEFEVVAVQTQFNKLIQEGHSYTEHETRKLCKDGRLLDTLVTLSPIKNRDGQVVAVTGIVRDLTESKTTQQLLVQTEKLSVAGQLAAGVAHEIRNPLTALKGFVQLMEGGAVAKEPYLRVMASELNRIELITNELLMLAKPQAHSVKVQDVGAILLEVIALFETQAILRDVQVIAELERDLPPFACDENQLKQVFINFLKNALEAMPAGGRIDIALWHDGDLIRVSFADQGGGIAPELLTRVGEPFFTTKEKGTGLGFMVCKQIIENHHGEIRIESVVGAGTTIEVLLPL